MDDQRAHQVGIRFLLDTLHRRQRRRAVHHPRRQRPVRHAEGPAGQAKDKKIPDFLQALEKPDLAHPGTIAHLRLKLEGLEPPERVTLGAWPNEKLRVLDRKANGPSTLWDVPVLSMKSLDLNDSAIVIYWKEQPLQAGRQARGRFRVRPVEPRQPGRPAGGDGRWRLPPRRRADRGRLRQPVRPGERGRNRDADAAGRVQAPRRGRRRNRSRSCRTDAKSGNVPVTWKVQAGPTGKYEFTVKSSSGLSQTIPVEIKKPIFD